MKNIYSTILLAIIAISCKKAVQIAPPTSSITTIETFGDSADANSAILGIYSKMINMNATIAFANGGITQYCGLSSDELNIYLPIPDNIQLYNNNLISTNGNTASLWTAAYSLIYQSNACIEGLQASTGISQQFKAELIGEAKFLRAFCYFYLVNLFGDVPYVSSSNWKQTSLTSRSSKTDVYSKVVADLLDAQNSLTDDYSIASGYRTRATKSTATALLARVYLYTGDNSSAERQATTVINNSNFRLESDLNSVFLTTSIEAILQWQQNTDFNPYNATPEGCAMLPVRATAPPTYYSLNPSLLSVFEDGDNRRTSWIHSSIYRGTTFYYPYKYKLGRADRVPGSTPTEFYTVLRLAEQYLIRAEARLKQGNDIDGAISDLNMLRVRAGLMPLNTSLSSTQVQDAIMHERQVELFCEWGHRWFDLKRTGEIDSVMGNITPQKGGIKWRTSQQLYPIPQTEILFDPNLTQNAGY